MDWRNSNCDSGQTIGVLSSEAPDIYYPINYGYIEGIMAPDGEEQDVYILGVDEPVKRIYRENYCYYT